MAYNPISTLASKVAEKGIALTLRAGTKEYPLVYADNIWQVATSGSPLYNAIGSTGSYTQETINNYLLEHIASGVVSIEVVPSTESVASPSDTTLYLVPSSDDATLFATYTYKNGTWTNAGTITLNLDKYTYAESNLTNQNLVYATGDKVLASTGVAKDDIEALINDFKGTEQASLPASPADGTIAKLLQEYREDGLGKDYTLPVASTEELGGIKTGFTQDDTNKKYPVSVNEDGEAFVQVPWSGNEDMASLFQDGLMSKNHVRHLNVLKGDIWCTSSESDFITAVATAFGSSSTGELKGFTTNLLIQSGNFLGITTTSDYRVAATFSRNSTTTGSEAFECKFSVGKYDFDLVYNGASFTLYHTDYVEGDANDVNFSI